MRMGSGGVRRNATKRFLPFTKQETALSSPGRRIAIPALEGQKRCAIAGGCRWVLDNANVRQRAELLEQFVTRPRVQRPAVRHGPDANRAVLARRGDEAPGGV